MKLLLLFFLVSCAKVSYVTKQGLGQVALEWNGKSVEDVLADPSVSEDIKRKVELTQNAKKYFFDYFKMKPTDIYDEITFLESDAVTYLVIHSPKNKIEAIKTSFPFVGEFPYLGFFSKEDALYYKSEKVEEGYHTYMRPVYAYSTLDQWIFDDNVLSSFFNLNDYDLVELIFHELVHTVIFVKNQVSFNENFAEFISGKLADEYFSKDKLGLVEYRLKNKKNKLLISKIMELKKKLEEGYIGLKEGHEEYLSSFLRDTFKPEVKKFCKAKQIRHCWPTRQVWNNARFAALGTYKSESNGFEELFKLKGLVLRDFFIKSIKVLDTYKNEDRPLKYLERKL